MTNLTENMKMKVIKKLEMLNIPVDFKNQIFCDLGNMTNVPDFIARLSGFSIESHKDAKGYYFQGTKGDDVYHFIAYQLDQNDIPQSVFIRGHEEMHALHGSGNLHLMQSRLNGFGNTFDFSKIPRFKDCSHEELEITADIGGIYSLLIRGMHYKTIKGYGDIHPKSAEVFDVHQQGAKILDIADIPAFVKNLESKLK